MRFLVLALALLLVSCGARSDQGEIKRQIDAVFAECERRAEAGELRTNVAEVQCQKDGSFRILEQNGSNDMDLMRLVVDNQMELAKRLDAGTAGRESLMEFEEIQARIDEEIYRRDRLYGKGSRHQPEGDRAAGNCKIAETQLVCVTP